MERNRPAAAVAAAIGRWTARSPGTYVWLTVLLVTSHLLGPLLPAAGEFVRLPAPADPHTLADRPSQVFLAGLLWLPEGGHWVLCAVLFTLFHAPAEQWLGTLRWCAAVAVAYVPAGLLAEAVLLWASRHGHAPLSASNSLVYATDQGLAGIAAVLTYRLPRVWRYAYAFAVLVFCGVPLGAGPDVTDLGRFTAALAGLACYPLTRGRGTAVARRPRATGRAAAQ
ncbi:rhomboid-like protein [Streptomyces sp. NPDC060184]|uniref:rhomboid-like protein n=1 Tax=Streptomyces sp. NPDC060184 TaxID=3347064 RepID=UPI003655498D